METPRTDKAMRFYVADVGGEYVPPDFARTLEREAATLRADNAALAGALGELQVQLLSHFQLNAKKHYSLMVADADASKALAAHAAKGA